MFKIHISFVIFLINFESILGSQDETQRNSNYEGLSKYQNPGYYSYHQQNYNQNPVASQSYIQIPIQLLQRSLYQHQHHQHQQQPQAAIIILKAYPVYIPQGTTSTSSHNQQLNYQGISSAAGYTHPGVQAEAQQPSSATQYVQTNSNSPATQYVQSSGNSANQYVQAGPTQYMQNSNSPVYYYTPQNNLKDSNSYQNVQSSSDKVRSGGSYLNQLAQMIAQQYSKTPSSAYYRTPAIITGLENFSPEQQSQIKNHLKNYIQSHNSLENSNANDVEQRESVNTNENPSEKYSYSSKTGGNVQYGNINAYQQQNNNNVWRPTGGNPEVQPSKKFGDKS